MRTFDECRCYVEHLIAEHRRVHRMLRQASSTMVQAFRPDHDATNADIVHCLQLVREQLSHHFSEEEGGGCLDEAVSRCPSLSAEARRIEAEHPVLLARIDGLMAQALDADGSLEKRVTISREFDELCRQLDAHEAAENALLRKGFGANVNSSENGSPTLMYDVSERRG